MADAPDGRRPELIALGNVIRAARISRQWEQMELASAAEITTRYLSDIEHGRANPSIELLLRIAEAFGLKASVLILRAEADTED